MLDYEDSKLLWVKISSAIFLQWLLIVPIFAIYPLFAWLMFGEGASSSLYTNVNTLLWVILPLIMPLVINIYQILINRKSQKDWTVKADTLVLVILLVTYLIFVTWWGQRGGFDF